MLSSLNYENKCTPKNENKELSSFWDAVDLAYDEFIVKVFGYLLFIVDHGTEWSFITSSTAWEELFSYQRCGVQ
jgi:hypothetical protein